MSALKQLFENKLSHIAIDDFLTQQQIQKLLTAITQQPEWQEPPVPKKFEHLWVDKKLPKHLFQSQYMVTTWNNDEKSYLELCKNYHELWRRVITDCGFDPFADLINYLKNNYQIDVKLARQNNLDYFPLVARDLVEEVLPHADYGPYEGKGWAIEEVKNQIAWNIYLTDPKNGGDTIVYDHIWHEADKLDENSYGIANFSAPIKAQFSVKPGRLVLFNSRNFHAVQKSSAERIAIGGLMGETNDGKFIAWG